MEYTLVVCLCIADYNDPTRNDIQFIIQILISILVWHTISVFYTYLLTTIINRLTQHLLIELHTQLQVSAMLINPHTVITLHLYTYAWLSVDFNKQVFFHICTVHPAIINVFYYQLMHKWIVIKVVLL